MSEAGEGGTTSSNDAGSDGFRPITTQDELNKIIGERVKRAKPADYDELKAKAQRLDDLEAATKPEIERANDRAAKAEAEVAALPAKIAEGLRGHLVELGVVKPEDEVLLTAATPDDLIAQVKRLIERDSDRKKNGNVVPNEGKTPQSPSGDARREWLKSLTADR